MCTYLLKNMTSDYATASGEEMDIGDFEQVPNGVVATMILKSGDRVLVTLEVLGEPSQAMVNRFIESSE